MTMYSRRDKRAEPRRKQGKEANPPEVKHEHGQNARSVEGSDTAQETAGVEDQPDQVDPGSRIGP